jgi:integrase
MRKKLTTVTVGRLAPPKAGRLEVWDTLLPGFGLRITDKNVRSYFVMYRVGDGPAVRNSAGTIIAGRRLRRLTLGNAKALRLDQARAKARAALEKAARNVDPARKADDRPQGVRGFVENYLARRKTNLRASTYAEFDRLLRYNVLPRWGDLRVADVKHQHIAALLDEMVERGAAVSANRLLSVLKTVFSHAVGRGIVDASPVAHMRMPTKERPRERALSDDELAWFWSAAEEMAWPYGHLFRLLALTGQRREQVRSLAWAELDLPARTWRISGARMKGGREHEVALSDLALEILAEAQQISEALKGGPLVFSSNGSAPLCGFSVAKATLDRLMEQRARVARGLQDDHAPLIPAWTLHDLRRTMVHGLAQLGFPPHVADKILAHSSGAISGVAAIYNRYEYMEERRNALAAWGERIAQLIGRGSGKVRSLRA